MQLQFELELPFRIEGHGPSQRIPELEIQVVQLGHAAIRIAKLADGGHEDALEVEVDRDDFARKPRTVEQLALDGAPSGCRRSNHQLGPEPHELDVRDSTSYRSHARRAFEQVAGQPAPGPARARDANEGAIRNGLASLVNVHSDDSCTWQHELDRRAGPCAPVQIGKHRF